MKDLLPGFDETLLRLPDLLGHHVILSLLAIVTGSLISLPLGVLAGRSRRIGAAALGLAGVVQTIPSLALLAIMVPLFALFLRPIGAERYAIGFWPAYVALSLYAVLPILRNTVVGIAGVPGETIEAARAMGMTDRQVLRHVQFPLATPTLVAGLRTASVFTVGIATLATPVGARCLGDPIFGGLATRRWGAVLAGCLTAAGLALIIDALIRRIERDITRRDLPSVWRTIVVAGVLTILAILTPVWQAVVVARPEGVTGLTSRHSVVIGGKPFTEQHILVATLSRRLEESGFRVDARENLGGTVLYDGLRAGAIDVYVDYTGTLWTTVLNRTNSPGPAAVLETVTRTLAARDGVTVLGPLGFENAYTLAMRREQADRLGVRTISDLATHAPTLRFAGDLEFLNRPEWPTLLERYGLSFGSSTTMNPSLMYAAARDGAADVITSYTTEGRVDGFGLVVLEDDLRVFPPYDAVILLSARAADDERLVDALRPMIESIDDDTMRRANAAVDVAGRSPAQAAGLLR